MVYTHLIKKKTRPHINYRPGGTCSLDRQCEIIYHCSAYLMTEKQPNRVLVNEKMLQQKK